MSNQDQKKLKLGVLGTSLNHSKSPEMQKAGLEYLGLEGEYSKFEISTENFPKEISKLLTNLDGLNITFPYKESILKYLNASDPLVERIRACNTISIQNSRIIGFNTDYFGFQESLKRYELKSKSVAILGAGGAAKAIIVALMDMGLGQINIYARNPNKVELNFKYNETVQIKLFQENNSFENYDLIINCTPVGQGRLGNNSPLNHNQISSLKDSCIVYDLIYSETQLTQDAKTRNLQTINGSEMLILQGAKSLSIWTGRDLTEGLIEAMRTGFHSNPK